MGGGARSADGGWEKVAVLERVADEEAKFEQCSSKSIANTSRESREGIHGKTNAHPRNRCLPRLQHRSQSRASVGSGRI